MTKVRYIKKFMNLLQEVVNLIVKFFKPIGLHDSMLKFPKNIKKLGIKVGIMNLGMTTISLGFAFLLKATNLMIEHRLILLGLMIFMLYRGQQVVEEAFYSFKDSEQENFEEIFSDEVVFRGASIIGKVSDKVLKFDKDNNFFKIMTNEEVINTIKSYLQNLWNTKIQHAFEIIEVGSVIIMLVFAIITNTEIPQKLFVPILLFFVLLSFLSSAYISLKRDEYYDKHRKYNNEQDVVVNDLLRTPSIVQGDVGMRINRFQKAKEASVKNVKKFHKEMNLSRLITTIIEVFGQYGIIIFTLLQIEWSTIDLSTITEITATLVIVETALAYIGDIARTLNRHEERVTVIEREESDMSLILDVYHKEVEKSNISKEVNNITINPFEIKYTEKSENDRPFTLVSQEEININKGEIVILSGPSGSGKSTFMKMITERIKLEKNIEIPSTSRYLFYDEKMVFGSMSLFEEMFCCDSNPNLTKMQEILENLHLWQEIKSNCIDVWVWTKENKFNNSLSNGQKQRLVLAKMLYWLDENIDVVVLDECTSGLDDKSEEDSADAERILDYIIKYCNKDKERIIVISTHQNISGVQQKLTKNGYYFKNLQFKKEGEKNLIKQI